MENSGKRQSTGASLDKSSRDPSHRLSSTLDDRSNINSESCERIETYDGRRGGDEGGRSSCVETVNRSSENSIGARERSGNRQDQEMMISCDGSSLTRCEVIGHDNPDKSFEALGIIGDYLEDDKSQCHSEESCREPRSKELTIDVSTGSRIDENVVGASAMGTNEPSCCIASSSNTDLDSPMSCEHTLEDLPDSGFVICDSSEKMLTSTETQGLASNTGDSGEWVMIERTTESVTTPTSDASSRKDPLDGTVNQAIASDLPRLRSTSDNVSRTSLDLTMGSNVDTDPSCIGTSDFTESPSLLLQQTNEMSYEPGDSKKESKNNVDEDSNVLSETNEIFVIDDRKYGSDRRNGNERPSSESIQNLDHNSESARMEQENQVPGSLRLDNENVYRGNMNEKNEEQRGSCEEENINADTMINQQTPEQQKMRIIVKSQQIGQYMPGAEPQQRRSLNETRSDNQSQERAQNHSFGQSPRKHQNLHHHHHHHHHNHLHHFKYLPKHIQENVKRNNMQNSQIRDNEEVVIASENAAEPCEIVHQPEGASETTSLDSSCTLSNSSSPIEDSVVLRDTAAILQELALQRLSGGVGSETPLNPRRRYESEITTSERRSFDSEIGREIVRERKMRQELDTARGKSEEPSPNNGMQYLPPCLRARHARSTRAALSRSLDEGKFKRMNDNLPSLPSKQTLEDSQHNSTPNVGTELSMSSSNSSDKLQSRNLGGLDLGDPRCRERIEKYKEERRMFLRDKYRSESFRGTTTSRNEDDGEQALLARLKQRASRPSLH